MGSQGPVIVNSGADGGEGGNTWANLSGVTQNDGLTYANCSISSGTSNTLKGKFNAGAFTIADLNGIDDISVSFKAYHSQGSGNVSSVKISLGATDQGNNAALGGTVATYTYDGVLWGGSPRVSAVDGAWEIDLRFTGPGTIQVQDVTATVVYGLDGPPVSGGNGYEGLDIGAFYFNNTGLSITPDGGDHFAELPRLVRDRLLGLWRDAIGSAEQLRDEFCGWTRKAGHWRPYFRQTRAMGL